MKKASVLLALLSLSATTLLAQTDDARGLNAAVKQLAGQTTAVGTQYAVLIAVDRYKNWNALRHPVADAREIKEILSRRYYVDRFIELYDEAATKAGIIRLFNELIVTARPEDGVFIFYAGHGYLDQMSDTGFWIPADGGLDTFAQDNWLPNSQIRGFISKMKARHIVLMSDSCFSGDILNPTRGITPEITNEYFRNAYSRISRQVLTSGASEAVPDASAFARGLKLALEGNTAPQLDPLMLYNQIRLGMKGTTPLLGDLKDSGHQEGASFLFFLKGTGAQASGGEVAPAGTEPSVTNAKPTPALKPPVGGVMRNSVLLEVGGTEDGPWVGVSYYYRFLDFLGATACASLDLYKMGWMITAGIDFVAAKWLDLAVRAGGGHVWRTSPDMFVDALALNPAILFKFGRIVVGIQGAYFLQTGGMIGVGIGVSL